MLYLVASLLLVFVVNDIGFAFGWNPSNFSLNPGADYELVWQDEFEDVGPVKAIINGQPAYSPNPKNWVCRIGTHHDNGIENYIDSIYNAYVQSNQLTIVAMEEGYQSAMLTTANLQDFTFGTFAAKIRLPYGQGIWPAFWMLGHDHQYNFWWPTVGEIDIVEMVGGSTRVEEKLTDQYAHANVHWNNQSNTMNPLYHQQLQSIWETPDGSMLRNNSLVYWAEWTPTNIRMGINEFAYYQLNTTDIPDSINPVWVFSGKWPFYLILDIAIGGEWALLPDNTTIWPQQIVVDWIRAYQKKSFYRQPNANKLFFHETCTFALFN